MVQGGDFLCGNGTGTTSIYGAGTYNLIADGFADENFQLRHSSAGLLSMANSGLHTNGSQFFFTCTPCEFLDGTHVVFGRILDGLLVLRKMENVPTVGTNHTPQLDIVIADCGEM